MDCKRLFTAEGGYALYRQLAICMLSVGLAAWAVPVAAQDDVASSPCANGIAVPNPQDHPGLVADCEVLLAVHEQLDGSLLSYLDWRADLPITEWYGITVSDSRVIKLSLSSFSTVSQERDDFVFIHVEILWGPIPPELGQLTNLTNLNLGYNQLTGPIPLELTQLTNLTSLNLGGNRLTGPIPTELGQLTNLEYLYLGYNQLTGPIPLELTQLTNLTSLNLGGIELTGLIPPELTQLTNLTNLNLGDIELTGSIPLELTQLTNLTSLNLGGNRLTGPIPLELTQLTNLTSLNLGGNRLTGPIPPALGQLTKLKRLYLYDNELTGPIPSELGQLTNLGYLHLGGNELTGPIPSELGQLTKLRVLDLDGNELTGVIPPALGQLTNLGYLHLGGNELTGPIPSELGQLTELFGLRLDGNHLTCIPATLEWDVDLPVCEAATAVESSVLGNLPITSGLDPNFPNPFNAHTQIPYRLATPGLVQLVVYNLLGQPVRTLVDQVQTAGWYQVPWDSRDQRGNAVSAGVYLTCLHYPGGVQTQRLLYLK